MIMTPRLMVVSIFIMLAGSVASSPPRVQLDCGVEVLGAEGPFNLHVFQGLRYAEPPDRFAPPQDIGCGDGGVIDATSTGSVCVQAASAFISLPMSIMNAFVLPFAKYILALFVLIFGLCSAHAAWKYAPYGLNPQSSTRRYTNDQHSSSLVRSFDNSEYSNLDEPARRVLLCSSPRVKGCALAALLPALLMLTLPRWAWTGMVGQEDCLFLNVFKPAAATTTPRPVMVWLHGGAFIAGSGSSDDPQYGSPAEMAASGVVHVTLNYRLGAFGFLFLDDGETVANVGLLDQLAALRWVQVRHLPISPNISRHLPTSPTSPDICRHLPIAPPFRDLRSPSLTTHPPVGCSATSTASVATRSVCSSMATRRAARASWRSSACMHPHVVAES